MNKKTRVLFEDLDEDNIDSLLKSYSNAKEIKEEIDNQLDLLREKIKNYLKERKWINYKDEKSKITVSLISQKKESVNKNSLKMLLNEEQYNQVITTKSFQKALIVTQKDRDKLKNQFKSK